MYYVTGYCTTRYKNILRYGGVQFLRKILGGKKMSVLNVTPRFLYPRFHQYPFDDVAEKIVKAIEKRNWKVPGIKIEFHNYGSGEAKYQMISCISGENFKLEFGRIQGRLNAEWNDIAGLASICIPKQILKVFSDYSGPNYCLYVGDNWEKDKKWFMNSIKLFAKLHNEPKRYLKYRSHTYNGRAKQLFPDDDLDREYLPEGDEPCIINLREKYIEFTKWLEKYVLEYILSFEEESKVESPVHNEEIIPYRGLWTNLYSICNYSEARRILTGKIDPKKLSPEDRHAKFGKGYRLAPFFTKINNQIPEIAYEGFIWCDVCLQQSGTRGTQFSPEVMNAMHNYMDHNFIVSIKLKYANQTYVVDFSKFIEIRQQLFSKISPERDTLNNEELSIAYASLAKTIIPVNEYQGGYKQPIVLINRELDFEEIESVKEMKE